MKTDIDTLITLAARFTGRHSKPLTKSKQRCRTTVYRDPRDVAYRYLRRFSNGTWLRCGSHVARPNFGAGIGFANWRNDRHEPVKPLVLSH